MRSHQLRSSEPGGSSRARITTAIVITIGVAITIGTARWARATPIEPTAFHSGAGAQRPHGAIGADLGEAHR